MLEERKALRKSVVGTYEFQGDGNNTGRVEFKRNGWILAEINGNRESRRWEIMSNVELYLHPENNIGLIGVHRINKDSSLTFIAVIRDGEREEVPKEKQTTYKKIK